MPRRGAALAALAARTAAGGPCAVTLQVGCYVDGTPRLLPRQVAQGDRTLTWASCAALCHAAGFGDAAYCGVEAGSQCYCGAALPAGARQAPGECTTPCTGDAGEACGGGWRLTVFQAACGATPAPPPGPPAPPRTPAPAPAPPGPSPAPTPPSDPYGPGPCDRALRGAAWCDRSAGFVDRARALVSNLTVAEKTTLFDNGMGALPRVDLPAYGWWSEALHGVANDGVATSFPQICGVAASLNRSLWGMIGNATGVEGRGKNNNRQYNNRNYKGLTFWAPNVNIFRDPRWGRGQETPGEDPGINGEYATHFVRGMQGDDPKYLKVSACLKHYAAYSEEQGRDSFPAVVTKQDMEDTYLPAFETGVEAGKATGLMCSYNAETYGYGVFGAGAQDGAIPSCANKFLMQDLARGKWGFDGYITSDCNAVYGVQNRHKYTNNTFDTVTAVLSAGMDTDCGMKGLMVADVMAEAYRNATVAALADAALVRLYTVQMRLGFFDPRSEVPWALVGSEVVNTPAHQALAREAADQSLVLLKNAGGALPLDPRRARRVAVVGRNANATTNMQGNYYGTAPYLVSPLAGIAKHAAAVHDDGSDIAAAVRAASGADAVVLVVGLESSGGAHADESEGNDRSSLLLPGNQGDLIGNVSAAAAARGAPVVVVVMSGGPVDVSAAVADAAVGAILWCGYPGQSGGDAIADAVFGVTNPSGRLTMTWYPEEFARTVKMKDMAMRPNTTAGTPGRSHRFYTGTPVFAFGYGLSYTAWDVSPPSVELRAGALATAAGEAARGATLAASLAVGAAEVRVRNAGARAGAWGVLLFAAPPGAAAARAAAGAPLRSLVGFEKVRLAPGGEATVRIPVRAHHLTLVGRDGVRRAAPGTWHWWTGAADGAPSAAAVLR